MFTSVYRIFFPVFYTRNVISSFSTNLKLFESVSYSVTQNDVYILTCPYLAGVDQHCESQNRKQKRSHDGLSIVAAKFHSSIIASSPVIFLLQGLQDSTFRMACVPVHPSTFVPHQSISSPVCDSPTDGV